MKKRDHKQSYGKWIAPNLNGKQMSQLPCSFILFVLLISCKPKYSQCEIETPDPYLKAYNDLFNEIVVKRAYDIYLGKDEERIFKEYLHFPKDSNRIEKEVIRLHNKLFNDTSRFCTIYLDTLLKPEFNSWRKIQNDTSAYSSKLQSMLTIFSKDGQEMIDSLNSIQKRYTAQNFTLCTAIIRPISQLKVDTPKCQIGKIVLSEIIFNKLYDQALLYYEFECGELCGYGSLIYAEKKNGHWYIKQSIKTWIA